MKKKSTTKKSILIVDDDIYERKGLAKILSERGFEVYEAENGHIGRNQWRKLRPDYMITDYQMPEMNGLELCMEIRQLAEWGELPVPKIVLISMDPPTMPKEVANIPVLQKPVDVTELLEKLGIK